MKKTEMKGRKIALSLFLHSNPSAIIGRLDLQARYF